MIYHWKNKIKILKDQVLSGRSGTDWSGVEATLPGAAGWFGFSGRWEFRLLAVRNFLLRYHTSVRLSPSSNMPPAWPRGGGLMFDGNCTEGTESKSQNHQTRNPSLQMLAETVTDNSEARHHNTNTNVLMSLKNLGHLSKNTTFSSKQQAEQTRTVLWDLTCCKTKTSKLSRRNRYYSPKTVHNIYCKKNTTKAKLKYIFFY